MAELLLELLSEDIPARMQARAAEDLKRLVTDKLKDAGLTHDKAEAYVTPRRLVLVVDGLPDKQPDVSEERKGPRVGAPEQAIQGFLKSAGLDSVDQCEKRETGKGTFLFAVITRRGKPTAGVLPPIIMAAINGLRWPKSMRWANTIFTWIRPLHSVLAIFNGKPLQQSFGLGVRRASRAAASTQASIFINFGNETKGHRFLAPEAFTVKDFADYKAKLKKAHVVLDPAERRKAIWKEAQKLAKAEGLTVKEDDALLAEVAGLVEWPKVFMGRIDQAFMDLPAEVLTTVMRHHQKYFSVLKPDGSLAPRFIVVADTEPDDGGKAITAGNERVLKARLADARFFWDHDRKATLESRVAALEGIIFHAKLGTLAEKVARVQALAAELAPSIPDADVDHVRRAALLSKADLTTEMVKEFPELQGVMGRYYALGDGERPEVAEAVAEHYAPLGPNDRCPTAPVSVAVALADKIDSLVGFFAINEKPTSSKDPYALRRAALGVIRLIVENNLRVSLFEVFGSANSRYPDEIRAPLEMSDHDLGVVSHELLELFVTDRLKVHLRQEGARHDLVSAVFAVRRPSGGLEDDVVRLLAKIAALEEFLDTEDGGHLLTAYKRASNIVRIEEKKDSVRYDGSVERRLLRQPEEKDLYARLIEVKRQNDKALRHERYVEAMEILARLRRLVDIFFDDVTVNCTDKTLRRNRLRLLSQIRTTMNTVADFSQIEG